MQNLNKTEEFNQHKLLGNVCSGTGTLQFACHVPQVTQSLRGYCQLPGLSSALKCQELLTISILEALSGSPGIVGHFANMQPCVFVLKTSNIRS